MKNSIALKSTRLEQNFRFRLAHCVTKSGRWGNDALHGEMLLPTLPFVTAVAALGSTTTNPAVVSFSGSFMDYAA
jgi:hypothetical protein